MVHAVPSLFLGFQSYFVADADLDVVAFGVGQKDVTSRDLAAKSLIDDVAAVVGVAHKAKDHLEAAWEEDIVEAVARNTFVGFAASAKAVVHTFYVGHVQRVMQLRLENSTEEYGMR